MSVGMAPALSSVRSDGRDAEVRSGWQRREDTRETDILNNEHDGHGPRRGLASAPTLKTAAPDSPSPGPPPGSHKELTHIDTPATLSPQGPSSSAPAPWSGTVLEPYQMEVGMELSSETRGWGGGDRSWEAAPSVTCSRPPAGGVSRGGCSSALCSGGSETPARC